MRIRIIERNDGKFQYEFCHPFTDSAGQEQCIWKRCDFLYFDTEEAARQQVFEILGFITRANMKRVVDTLDVPL